VEVRSRRRHASHESCWRRDYVAQTWCSTYRRSTDDGSTGEHVDAERSTGGRQTRRWWADVSQLDDDGRSTDSAAMDRRSKKIRSCRLSIDSDLSRKVFKKILKYAIQLYIFVS